MVIMAKGTFSDEFLDHNFEISKHSNSGSSYASSNDHDALVGTQCVDYGALENVTGSCSSRGRATIRRRLCLERSEVRKQTDWVPPGVRLF